jgi:hypothetical protein
MIIRLLLLSGLAAIGWLVFLRRTRLPFHIVIVFAVLAVAALAVIFPDLTAEAAQLVGVGRGVDLVTYLVEIGALFVLLHYYTKFVELAVRWMIELVRDRDPARRGRPRRRAAAPTIRRRIGPARRVRRIARRGTLRTIASFWPVRTRCHASARRSAR